MILGLFAAGALLSVLDQDRRLTHPSFRTKLEAMGFGPFIAVFFVTVGLRFDLQSLLDDPAISQWCRSSSPLCSWCAGCRPCSNGASWAFPAPRVAGVLQATSLPFIVAATAIGMELGAIDAAEASALIAAGVLSVLIFPITGLTLLRRALVAEGTPAPGGASERPATVPRAAM